MIINVCRVVPVPTHGAVEVYRHAVQGVPLHPRGGAHPRSLATADSRKHTAKRDQTRGLVLPAITPSVWRGFAVA
jgi:hypothetical protein